MHHEMEELDGLLEYLIKHNSDHAEEIVVLAGKAKDLGMDAARDDLMKGVEDMNKSNESLKRALKTIRDKK
jgi:hypothetical protein